MESRISKRPTDATLTLKKWVSTTPPGQNTGSELKTAALKTGILIGVVPLSWNPDRGTTVNFRAMPGNPRAPMRP